jgi:hypothetical protein
MKKTMIITLVLFLMLGVTPTTFAGAFADVPANNWAYGAVNQLAKAGLINGYSDNSFRGDKTITRYEMAIIIAKAMENTNKADAANKALINKLSAEYSQELATLGVRVSTLETKVDKLQVHGFEQLWIRSIHDKPGIGYGGLNSNFGDNLINLNIDLKVDDNTTVFTRFAERSQFGGAKHSVQFSQMFDQSNLDWYGVKVKTGNWDLSAGRQAIFLGQGGVLSTGDVYGSGPLFEGLIATTKFNNVTAHLIGGHTNTSTVINNIFGGLFGKTADAAYAGATWFGGDAFVKLSDRLTLGGVYAHEKKEANTGYSQLPAINYYAVNASYNFSGPFTLNTEVIKSDADTANKAWSISGIYHQDKETLMLVYVRTQKNSIDQLTNWIQGGYQMPFAVLLDQDSWHGNIYGWTHDLTKAIQFRLMYMTTAVDGKSGQNNEWVSGFTFGF